MPSKALIATGEVNAWLQSLKDRLTLMLGANAAVYFKLKSVLICYSKNYAKSTLPVLYKWKNKAW